MLMGRQVSRTERAERSSPAGTLRSSDYPAAVLDRRGELVLDVPGKVDPLRLLEFLDESIDDRPPGRLGVKAGEMRLWKQLAHGLRGFSRVHQVIDQQVALALPAYALQHLHLALLLGSPALCNRVVARHADRVDEPNV